MVTDPWIVGVFPQNHGHCSGIQGIVSGLQPIEK